VIVLRFKTVVVFWEQFVAAHLLVQVGRLSWTRYWSYQLMVVLLAFGMV